ncbi:MAG: type VII toxin-antitoxin system HepT family RNase toxin [Pseudonocardiaceae bacterium]
MVDEVRVLRLLRSISDDLAVLRAEASADPERRADLLWLRGVKYTFVTAIEAGVDVAQHVCASKGWGPPRDNGDVIRLLGAHGVLSADLADRLRRAVGFRKVLIRRRPRRRRLKICTGSCGGGPIRTVGWPASRSWWGGSGPGSGLRRWGSRSVGPSWRQHR